MAKSRKSSTATAIRNKAKKTGVSASKIRCSPLFKVFKKVPPSL